MKITKASAKGYDTVETEWIINYIEKYLRELHELTQNRKAMENTSRAKLKAVAAELETAVKTLKAGRGIYEQEEKDMPMYSNKFLEYFYDHVSKTYEELYDGGDTEIIGEKRWLQALDHFDNELNREEKNLLKDFVTYRRDFVTSDREAVAFVLSLNCINTYRDQEYETYLKKRHKKH